MKQTKKPTLTNTYRFFRIYHAELATMPCTKLTMGHDSDGYFVKRSYSDEEVIKAHIPLKKGEKVEDYMTESGENYVEIMTAKDN